VACGPTRNRRQKETKEWTRLFFYCDPGAKAICGVTAGARPYGDVRSEPRTNSRPGNLPARAHNPPTARAGRWARCASTSSERHRRPAFAHRHFVQDLRNGRLGRRFCFGAAEQGAARAFLRRNRGVIHQTPTGTSASAVLLAQTAYSREGCMGGTRGGGRTTFDPGRQKQLPSH